MVSWGDPLDEAGLRAAAADAREEWRADEQHWSAAALEQWRHTRTLLDLARDHLHRGDTIAFRWPGATVAVTGRVIGVSDDAVAVATFAGRVDVALAPGTVISWSEVDSATRGGSRGIAPLTFRARLLELESLTCEVDVAHLDGEVVRGVLRVGRDHVQVVAPDATWAIAVSALRWVRESSPA